MLTAAQIDVLREASGQLLDPVTDFLIEDIARRVSEAGQLTGTAAYQVWRAQNLGMSQKQLKKELQKKLKVSEKELEKLLKQAAKTGYNFDLSRLPTTRGIPFAANSSLQQIINLTVQQANKDLTNITRTMGFIGSDGKAREMTKAYKKACDDAFLRTVTGAQDYNSAIRDALKGLYDKGIVSIDYGFKKHFTVEAAVRQNIMGGLGLMQEKISQQNHDDLGCDGWEISAHANSAPDHEPYQGKQYTDKQYQALNNSLLRRIGTLNCGHAAFPIIMGVNSPQYTEEELEEFRQQNEAGVTVDGRHYTGYEATQRQRNLERAIRNQKRKILIDKTVGDDERLQNDQIKLVRLRDEYARFSKAAGLPTQHARAEVAGFTRKEGKEAEKVTKLAGRVNEQNEETLMTTKGIEISAKYGTIDTVSTDNTETSVAENSGDATLQYVARLDIEKYKCVTEDIITDEVVITDERIQHIKDNHPADYERFNAYIPEAIQEPDYIIEDKHPATAMVLKHIVESGEHFRLAIRLATSADNPEYKNSVLTFWKIREKEWNRLIRNKNVLYKSE